MTLISVDTLTDAWVAASLSGFDLIVFGLDFGMMADASMLQIVSTMLSVWQDARRI